MTPAEVLAAAADRLDKLAGEAEQGPWAPRSFEILHGVVSAHEHIASTETPIEAQYIAAMNPLVGKALAEVFRSEAQAFRGGEQRGFDGADLYRVNPRLMALARLIIGGES